LTSMFSSKQCTILAMNMTQIHLEKIRQEILLQPGEISVSSIDDEFIRELQHVINANLSDSDFHVDALSKKMLMDRTTVYRKITALTGQSPTQIIRSYRLKRAAHLLKGNFGTVTQVALEVGFLNVAYFAKCFKEEFHLLPSAFLETIKKKQADKKTS